MMSPAQWARVTTLFDEARTLPRGERDGFLSRTCPDDPLVRDEVLSLLAADTDDDFLGRGAPVQPVDLLDQAGGHEWRPGESIGPYRVERLLARGGMGVLYVARDLRLERLVTLKVLPAATARDPQARARLQREARLAASLRHPHVVSVHALEHFGASTVIVAEYVEGPTLADVIRQQGPLPRDQWLALARTLADALAAAHAAQVIHRDVKASNVVLGRDGVRLIDFGIAVADGEPADGRVTQAGQMSGTPLALAPEQLEGTPATAAADQFAFGVLLYEAAAARLPFGEGAIAGVWRRMLRDEVTPLSAVAPQLDAEAAAVVHRCLARRPADRFASMRDVADALQRLADTAAGVGVGSTDVATAQTASRRAAATTWGGLHHSLTSLLYVGLLWPGWLLASALPGRWRTTGHLGIVCLAAVATSLRLHLWFSGRHYPAGIARRRQRLWPVLTAVDVVYAAVLGTLAWLSAETRLVSAVVTAGLVVSLLMASLVIEPATRSAEQPDA